MSKENLKKYKGVIVPAVTPLTSKYKLDKEAVEKIFSRFYDEKLSPFILGTTGESASLPLKIKQQYAKKAGQLKKKNTILYAGISSNCIQESVEFAKFCFDQGADAAVVTMPGYYTLTEDQMKKYFIDLADAIASPLIIYNIPATIHSSIPVAIVDELSHHPHIAGIKDSEKSDERLQESLLRWKDRKDFHFFSGWAARSAAALLGGADGIVPSTGNLVPEIYSAMLKAVKEGNQEKANEMQELSDAYGDLYQKGRTLGESLWALKFLMQEKGICRSYVMPPLQPQSDVEVDKLRKGLKEGPL
jgi:4-hydroxy-tetrahydrodipicolinate synthase